MTRRVLILACGGIVGVLGLPAVAQQAPVPEVLVREGQWIGYPTGGGAVQLRWVESIDALGANRAGGYAVVLETSVSTGPKRLSHVWGTATGSSPGFLLTESTQSGVVQASFSRRVDLDDAGVPVLSANVLGAPAGFRSSVWSGNAVLALEGDAAPNNPNLFWRFAGTPKVSDAGVPMWIGGLTTDGSMTARTTTTGLFQGMTAQPVLLSGTTPTGLPYVLADLDAVGPSFDLSSDGLHSIAVVRMETGSTADDHAVVMDGAGLSAGGTLIRESLAVAATGAVSNETWERLGRVATNDVGGWSLSAVTSDGVDQYAVLVADSAILHRTGDTVDGVTLGDTIRGMDLSDDGDLVSVWNVTIGNHTVVLMNGAVVLQDGDAVDIDGDGVEDTAHTLERITRLDAITISERSSAGLATAFVHLVATIHDATTGMKYDAVLRLEVNPSGLTCESIDYDQDGEVTSDDFDAYMALWQSSSSQADLNNDGSVNSQDIVVFADLYALCCSDC